jgi:SAM-dependent methyltransferase
MAITEAPTLQFDPLRYKETTHDQWQVAAAAWHRWGPTLERWLGEATGMMLDGAGVAEGSIVLDIAAGAGGQSIAAARRAGRTGSVLATDISSNILEFARQEAERDGLTNVTTRVMDGEQIDVAPSSFDAVISRLGLMYFPDQQAALSGMVRALKPGGRFSTIVFTTPDRNQFFSIPISIIRRRAQLPPPAPGQPGPFSLGAAGVLEAAFKRAGFQQIETVRVDAPVRLSSAAECVRFERESFGALGQMLSSLDEAERAEAWAEIGQELRSFETPEGFSAPCELIVASAVK